jgi:hypothetical protein
MSETIEARIVARKILNRQNCDPYDAYNVLARQFFVYDELLQKIIAIAEGSTTANSLPHIAKIARGEAT